MSGLATRRRIVPGILVGVGALVGVTVLVPGTGVAVLIIRPMGSVVGRTRRGVPAVLFVEGFGALFDDLAICILHVFPRMALAGTKRETKGGNQEALANHDAP